jgi:hypothetical protein
VAGFLLAFSAIVLTLTTPADLLASHAGLAMLIVFLNGWLIAVAERACMPKGGLRVPRFPLGPRVLQTRPGLFGQLVVFIALLALVTASWKVTMWGAIIVMIATVQAFRKMAWYVVPAALVVNTLATMPEFHTLGDLVHDAHDWLKALVLFGVQALIVCGPILRTDVGAPLSPLGQAAAFVAGLPAWGAAFVLFSHTPLAGAKTDLDALISVLLVGGLLQSLILAALQWAAPMRDRDNSTRPAASAYAIGLGLLPLLMPIVAAYALFLVPASDDVFAGTPRETWTGLLALLVIVPAVPAAGLVGAALDRLDERNSGIVPATFSIACLAGWFLLGPVALKHFYTPNGTAGILHLAFDTQGGASAVVSGSVLGAAKLSGPKFAGSLTLLGLPAADLCRSVTLMMLFTALLSARYMRHARPGQKPVGWGSLILLLLLQAGASWWLLPRMGPVGAPIAVTCASIMMLLLDFTHAEIRVEVPEEPIEEPDFSLDELVEAPEPQEVVT